MPAKYTHKIDAELKILFSSEPIFILGICILSDRIEYVLFIVPIFGINSISFLNSPNY